MAMKPLGDLRIQQRDGVQRHHIFSDIAEKDGRQHQRQCADRQVQAKVALPGKPGTQEG